MMGEHQPQASTSSAGVGHHHHHDHPLEIEPEIITLSTSDSFPTRAGLFHPAPSSDPHAAAVVIAAATGVPGIHYYGAFASYLATHGHPVLTFDYRYSGISFPADVDVHSPDARLRSLRQGSAANISTHWRIDAQAAIQLLHDRYCAAAPHRELIYIGNSAGLYVLPLSIPQRDLVDRALGVSSFFPHHYFLPDSEERRLGLKTTIEASRRAGVYFTHLVGKNITDELKKNGKRNSLPPFGADMTLGMGEEWNRWCDQPQYIATEHQAEYSSWRPRSPLVTLTFADDAICGGRPLASDQLLQALPLARSHRLFIDPAQMGDAWRAGCRHVDLFREAQRDGAWAAVRRWIETGEEPRGRGVDRREYGGTWEAVAADQVQGAPPLKAKL